MISIDARWFQILFLGSFLGFGVLAREFALNLTQIAATFAAALATQVMWQFGLGLPQKKTWGGYLSAIVSSFGICILVRAENAWVHPLLACVAMSSKFILRAGQGNVRSHVLNPANFAAFLAWAYIPGAWLSPGQWGAETLAALWFLALGGVVTQRIQRLSASATFLLAWAILLAGRLFVLDYAWNPGFDMWVQQMSNGAVLLFTFFMISDPMTTPQHKIARLGYVVSVACAAFLWQYLLFKPHGLIVMLFWASWFVPLINKTLPKERFLW